MPRHFLSDAELVLYEVLFLLSWTYIRHFLPSIPKLGRRVLSFNAYSIFEAGLVRRSLALCHDKLCHVCVPTFMLISINWRSLIRHNLRQDINMRHDIVRLSPLHIRTPPTYSP